MQVRTIYCIQMYLKIRVEREGIRVQPLLHPSRGGPPTCPSPDLGASPWQLDHWAAVGIGDWPAAPPAPDANSSGLGQKTSVKVSLAPPTPPMPPAPPALPPRQYHGTLWPQSSWSRPWWEDHQSLGHKWKSQQFVPVWMLLDSQKIRDMKHIK